MKRKSPTVIRTKPHRPARPVQQMASRVAPQNNAIPPTVIPTQGLPIPRQMPPVGPPQMMPPGMLPRQ